MKKKCVSVILSFFMIVSLAIPIAAFAYSNDDVITLYPNIFKDQYDNNKASTLSWTYPATNSAMRLYVSNNPEDVYQQGILGRDTVINENGRFRVYWAHRNKLSVNAYIGMMITNNTGKTIKVNLGKRAWAVSNSNTTTAQMGQDLLYKWLASDSSEYTYATLQNGQTTWIGFQVGSQHVGTGMYDVTIRDTSNNIVKGGITLETYLTYNSTGNPTALKGTTPLSTSGGEVRARCNHATKYLTWNPSSNREQITFTSTLYNSWPAPANDTDSCWSGIDQRSFELRGSYGQDLNITVTVPANSALVFGPQFEQSPTYTSYLAANVTGRGTIKQTVNPKQGWIIKTTGNKAETVVVQTSLPGYHFAPLRLAVIPNN